MHGTSRYLWFWFLGVTGLLALSLSAYQWLRAPTEEWSEDVTIHTGQILRVDRTVAFTLFNGELSQAFTRWPNQYSLQFRNPQNGQMVAWRGERGVNPVTVDIINGTPWLVVNSNAVYFDPELYGCSELPYAYLRFDPAGSRWKPEQLQRAPVELRRANLTYSWYQLRPKKPLRTSEDIARSNMAAERDTRGFFMHDIPKKLDDWDYFYKKQHVTSRYPRDCRHPLEKPVDAIFPHQSPTPSVPVEVETLESRTFSPKWVIPDDSEEYRTKWLGPVGENDPCTEFFLPADQSDARLAGWYVFAKNPTGTRLVSEVLNRWCTSEAIWFYSYIAEPKRTVIVKVSPAGDVMYRLSFPTPDKASLFSGGIKHGSLRAREGNLYFEWWNTNQSGTDRVVSRIMKLRLREPVPQQPK